MTFKIKLTYLVLFILLSYSNLKSQNSSSNKMLDINGHLILNCNKSGFSEPDSCIYTNLNGNRISVSFDVQYKGGYASLHKLCDSLYYKTVKDNYQEQNATAYYFILFDKHLNVKEIRLHKRIGFSCCKYDDIIINVLSKTEGNWELKTENSANWYVYFGRFLLR